MEEELLAIERNQTWELVDLPEGKNLIRLKWIYKTKYLADGIIQKYKARLVVRGFTQQQGIVYEETFSPVARFETVQMILAVAAQEQWKVYQFDIKSAFLNGELKEEVNVSQPPGFESNYEPSKKKYVDDTLKKFNMHGCKIASTLMNENEKFKAEDETGLADASMYRSLVGRIGEVLIKYGGHRLLVPGVHYAQEVTLNILSLDLLEKQGYEVKYENNRCSLAYMFDSKESQKFDEDKMRILHNNYLEDYFESLAQKNESINKFNKVVEWFYNYYLERSIHGPIPPTIKGIQIHLFDLYKLVEGLGGYLSVHFCQEFDTTGEILGLSKGNEEEIKECYMKYLDVFTSYFKTARASQKEYTGGFNQIIPKMRIKEEGKDRDCLGSHPSNFGKTGANITRNAVQKAKGKLEHFGVKLEDTEEENDNKEYSYNTSVMNSSSSLKEQAFQSSKKQTPVALSSTEAEYVAAAAASCQVVWLRRILSDLGHEQVDPTSIKCNNSIDERVAWIDVEGVPLKVWSRNTFAKISSKWGSLLYEEDEDVPYFHQKRLCIKTTSNENIFGSFKIVIKGKIFWIRVKEVSGWALDFSDSQDDSSESDNEFVDDKSKDGYSVGM
nr:bulb-type lectin domain-containing protein [Tanacetum cinerariifolium]